MEFDFDREDRKPFIKKIAKEVAIWAALIVLVITLAYFFVAYAIERTTVIGDSMNTTLADKDKLIINKFVYHFTDPKRFDIIVFKQNGKEHSYYNIKRIIGLPGETIFIQDGTIYINDNLLEEDINVELMNNGGLADETITLENNEYFVLGDNRNNSEDSRFANIGNVVKEDIVGKLWISLNSFNFVNQLNKKSNAPSPETQSPTATSNTLEKEEK